MKKISLFAIVILMAMGSQVRAGDLVALGLKGGISNNWARTNTPGVEDNINSYLGYQVGAYTRINLPIVMGIKGEVLYTAKGFNAESQGFEQEVRTGWVEIPLLLSFGLAGKVELDIGPQFSFLVSKNYSDNFGSGLSFDDVFDGYGSTEIGLAIGADVNIIKRLGAYLRYTYMFDNSYNSGGDVYDLGQSNLQLGVKIRLMN